MTTIAVDVDSVLFPINELVILPLLSARLGREVLKREITSWDYGDIDGGKEVAYEVFKRPNLYDGYDLRVTPGADVVLDFLRFEYDRVIAVSTPFQQHASSKWAYIERCGFDFGDIFLTGDKASVKFDVLVDDAPHTAQLLGAGQVVIFDQPWNRGDELRFFHRAFGWGDVTRKVARLVL